MQLVMNNYEIKSFGEFLYELTLKGKDSRMRSRFLSILETQLELIAKERDILLQDFGKKNENGEIASDTDEEGRQYVILEDKDSYNIEISKLMSEEFVIEVTPTMVDMVKSIQNIVLDCDKEFSGVEAERYNRYCDIMEQFTYVE
ncbi:hypothetical protein ACIQ1D_19295 [Lysinibacillus xylanilyticus]|uniref:hypothetical protein n=1 Tax=Lysinibacillus xylanilyticus TaxID=582475 RepID=UPI0037F8387C